MEYCQIDAVQRRGAPRWEHGKDDNGTDAAHRGADHIEQQMDERGTPAIAARADPGQQRAYASSDILSQRDIHRTVPCNYTIHCQGL